MFYVGLPHYFYLLRRIPFLLADVLLWEMFWSRKRRQWYFSEYRSDILDYQVCFMCCHFMNLWIAFKIILDNCGMWNVARCSKGLPKIHISIFSFRIKLMAEGELKDMEQFFDDLSDSFSGTEPEVHKTSVVGMKLFWGEQTMFSSKWAAF